MNKKHKKTCRNLNYVDHLRILTSGVTGCVSISAFVSLDDNPEGIGNSAATIKICLITAGIKNSILIIMNLLH